MKSSEGLHVNKLYYSKRYNDIALCTAVADFMVYLVFDNPGIPSGWYHCQEIEKKPNNVIDLQAYSCYSN